MEVSGPGWDVAARCLPARVVAGDFYDILRHTNGTVDVVVADVAGKGFAASLIMASVKAMLPFVTAEDGVAESLAQLNHPHIVTIYAVGEHEGQPYIVMDYVAGRTLREALRQGIGREVALGLLAGVAEPSGFVPLGEPLLGHVRPRPGYEPLAHRLLGQANIVPNLDEVLDLLPSLVGLSGVAGTLPERPGADDQG